MTAIPLYGIVEWLDAARYRGKHPKKPRSELCRRIAVGMLTLAVDGTLVIVHEYDRDAKGLQRDMEGSVIPMGWVTKITPLTEAPVTPKKVEGIDALHSTE